jgi:hypothetical protein
VALDTELCLLTAFDVQLTYDHPSQAIPWETHKLNQSLAMPILPVQLRQCRACWWFLKLVVVQSSCDSDLKRFQVHCRGSAKQSVVEHDSILD